MTSQDAGAPPRPGRAPSAAAFAILATLCGSYVVSQFLRNAVGVIAPNLAAEMNLSAAQIGLLASAYFFAFAAVQIPLGLAIDRFGPRRCLLLCAGIIVAGACGFATATSAEGLIAGRILLGLGSSSFLMAPLAIYARWFPPQRFSTLTGLHVGIGSLGALLATAPLAAAASLFGWRASFLGVAVLAALAGCAIAIVVRDSPPGMPARTHRPDTWRDSIAGAVAATRIPSFWRLFAMNLFMHASFVLVVGLWGGPYLTHIYGFDLTQRGEFLFVPAVAQIVGAFFWGPMDRLFGSHKTPVLLGGGLAAGALLSLAGFGVLPLPALLGLFAALGFATASLPVLVAHGKALLPPHLIGRGMTILNMASMGGVFFSQTASGFLIAWFPAPDGVYPLAAYQIVFGLQALCLIGGALCYAGAREPARLSV